MGLGEKGGGGCKGRMESWMQWGGGQLSKCLGGGRVQGCLIFTSCLIGAFNEPTI